MRTLFRTTSLLVVLAAQSFAADSVFVEGAWNGTWSAKFPPFVNQLIGPVTFNQIPDAEGPARMDALRTSGTAAANCPGPGERTEYYAGIYNYNNRGKHVGCTNGDQFFVVYLDDDGGDRGTMLITETFPGEDARFVGTFTSDGQPTGNIEGFYQGGGIATPLARIGSGGGGGGSDFTGCRFIPGNLSLFPHHPQAYSAVGRRYLGLEPRSISVEVLNGGQPVSAGTIVLATASSTAFAGPGGMPADSARSASTNENGEAVFPVNPPAPMPHERIELTAKVRIGDEQEEFECTGSIDTGIHRLAVPYLDRLDEAVSEIERIETEDDRNFQAKLSEDQASLLAKRRSPRRPPEAPAVRLPLIFEENRGQVASTARFVAKTLRGELEVGPTHVAIPSKGVGPGPAIDLEFVGANTDAAVSVDERLPGRSHYLIGADPRHWIRGAEHAAKVRFASVYRGIDVVYYGNRQRLEYDFEISPEANPDQIRMRFDGPAEPAVTKLGDLVVDDGDHAIRLRKPVVYQEGGEGRTLIAASYRIDESGDVRFELGPYDREQPLVIDPILEMSTLLGGADEDVIADVALDQQGNIYLTGATSSPGLATEQAFKSSKDDGGFGQSDGFIAKLDPSGTQLLFLTYFGGSRDETPSGVAVDAEGSILVTGTTTSEDFPTAAPYQSQLAKQLSFGGLDAFVLKLNSTGAGLVYSTYLGGQALELGGKIDVDGQGNAYVVGGTTSTDFPVTNAFQPLRGSADGPEPDAFAAKLGPTGAPVYVTYLGGSESEWGFAVAADSSGAAWFVGMTHSEDFPIANAVQPEHGGALDVFATKLSADGQALQTSGFLGGSDVDKPNDAAVDAQGNLYLTGPTRSEDFPLVGAVQTEFGGGELSRDAFVAKISASGTQLAYSTYFGGSGSDTGYGIAVGADGSAYVGGETTSSDLPLVSASQAFNAGGGDGFLVKLSPSGGQLSYATYLGGSLDDVIMALALDEAGRVVTVGTSYSPDFSATAGSLQPDLKGGPEGFVARLAPGNPPPSVLSLSGASFLRIHGLAPDSFATAFGSNLTSSLVIGSDLPTTLDGVTLAIVDTNGASHQARLYIVSPTQINYLIPATVAPGIATITVRKDGQVRGTETVRIATTAPGIFSAASNGSGVAAAVFLLADPVGGRSTGLVFDGNLASVPLTLGPEGSELYVFLFGTGLRNASGETSVTVDGVPVPFAGPVAQGEFDGLDQINLGPLPRSLAGRGEVQVLATVDGKEANAVTLTIQ